MKTHSDQLRLSGYGSFKLFSLVASMLTMVSVHTRGVNVVESCPYVFLSLQTVRDDVINVVIVYRMFSMLWYV